jgi:hypothetical protein
MASQSDNATADQVSFTARSLFFEMYRNFIIWNVRSFVVNCFKDLAAKPSIMRFAALYKFERQCPFVRRPGE